MTEKILIVDDDVETLRLVGLMLQRQGYQIVAANNGSQAISMARAESPDLIILDVMMPDMDGYQVTAELRKDPQLADTPILMFTAKSQVDDKVAGYDAGVDDYLTKPVHPAELIAHLKALLSRTRARQPAKTPKPAAYTVGVVGCKGGLGSSTLAINLAA
ncbi:MAG: response regulator transcription factor, partial [Anaerolineaceae bacterium]